MISRFGLILFLSYLPLFLVLLGVAVRKYRGYSFTDLWMSNLGDTRYASSHLFNTAFFWYGVLSLFFVYHILSLVGVSILSILAIVSLYVCSIATMIASQIPMNKNLDIHHFFSNMVFIGVTVGALFLMYPLIVSIDVPQYISILNLLLIMASATLTVSFQHLVKKEGKIPITLEDVRKRESSFFLRTAAVQEWIFFLVVLVWNAALGLIMLRV